jgi:hypothetical protein
VQLETPPTKIASSPTISKFLRRRRHPIGSNTNPHTTGASRQSTGPFGRANVAAAPVEISTVTFPTTPLASVSVAGLKVQTAFAGRVPHRKPNVPCDPFNGVMINL